LAKLKNPSRNGKGEVVLIAQKIGLPLLIAARLDTYNYLSFILLTSTQSEYVEPFISTDAIFSVLYIAGGLFS